MKTYISPRIEVHPIWLSASILADSGGNNMPIDDNGAKQIDAW